MYIVQWKSNWNMSLINVLEINYFYFGCPSSVPWQAQISATYDLLFEVPSFLSIYYLLLS